MLLHPLQIPRKLARYWTWASLDFKKTASVMTKQTEVILFNKLLQIYLFCYFSKYFIKQIWLLLNFTGTSTALDVIMKKNTQIFFNESRPNSHFTDPVTSYRHKQNLHKYGTSQVGTLGMQHLALTVPWLWASSRTGIWGHNLVAFSRGMLSTVEEHCRKWTGNESGLVAIRASISVSNASL